MRPGYSAYCDVGVVLVLANQTTSNYSVISYNCSLSQLFSYNNIYNRFLLEILNTDYSNIVGV